jgi:hypothetical protein
MKAKNNSYKLKQKGNYFFSTFQRNAIGATMIPERFVL